jgi:hypothetical protein
LFFVVKNFVAAKQQLTKAAGVSTQPKDCIKIVSASPPTPLLKERGEKQSA